MTFLPHITNLEVTKELGKVRKYQIIVFDSGDAHKTEDRRGKHQGHMLVIHHLVTQTCFLYSSVKNRWCISESSSIKSLLLLSKTLENTK